MNKNTSENELHESIFILLAILSEGPSYGYDLQKIIKSRGIRYWVNLGKSSIYNNLKKLTELGYVNEKIVEGEAGPPRKRYTLTSSGKMILKKESYEHLTFPSHPRSELALGVYSIPLLSHNQAKKGIKESITHLKVRLSWLDQRIQWCQDRDLTLPLMSFEHAKVLLEVEIDWLEKLGHAIQKNPKLLSYKQWQKYVYSGGPPNAERF